MERNVKAQGFENFREHRRGGAVTDGPQGVPRVVSDSQVKPDWSFLCTLATDPPGQLDVLGHDGDTLGVDGAQVGVLEQPNQVGLAGLLKKSGSEATKHMFSLKSFTCRAPMAADWNLKSVLKSWAISLTNLWKGSLRISSSVDFW